jgi:hypothetical protein
MEKSYISQFREHLHSQGVTVEKGLSTSEVDAIQGKYKFRFPPDLLELLSYALPVSKSFPDWRNGNEYALAEKLRWPADGICFDIQHNNFWLNEWPTKPPSLDEALHVARREVAKAPTLIPIYSHRYIPAEPQLAGNPVFSVYQTDIIYYGIDLASYFAAEFGMALPPWTADEPRYIRFWSDLVG